MKAVALLKTLALIFFALAAFPFHAPAQNLSSSKLSIHLLSGYTSGASSIISAKPRVLKVLATDTTFPSSMVNAMRDYKASAPGGKIVVRIYSPKIYGMTDDPTLSAADFWTNHMLPPLNQLSTSDKALIDYLEGPNEGETPTLGYDPTTGTNKIGACQWFNQFWTNLTPKIVNAGFKPCIGSIAVGNPAGDIAEMQSYLVPFVPALRQAKAAGGAWSYHAYTLDSYPTDAATDIGGELWTSIRYRRFYDFFAQSYPDLMDMPLILTEAGVDLNGTPATSGWQTRGTAAQYQHWLNWFDRRMQEDSYLLGCTLFQSGDGYWSSFEVEPIANWLANYLTAPNDFPSAPTGVSATTLDSRIKISWTSVPANPTTYNVKRSAASGGPYTTIATGVTEGVTATTYTDWTAPGGVPSYYVVSAVTAFGESANSAEVSATPALPKINCGGWDISPFLPNIYYNTGNSYAPPDTINTNGLVNPAPMDVYRSQHYGADFTYTIPYLRPNTSYKVRLHFAEVYYVFNSAGQRVFNVFINGSKVLNNFDIWVAAGGQFKGNIQEFNAVSDSSGKIAVQFVKVVDNASINGIEIVANATNSVPAAPSNLTAAAASGNVTLNWTAPAGATSFKVKRSTVNGGPYTTIASNLYAATFNDVSYSVGTPYYYVVSALNVLGESPNSNQANATPTNALPDVIATALTWTNASIAPGNSVFFKVTVKNQGSASVAAGTLGIGFLIDGAQVSYVGAGNGTLAPGASATYTANGGGVGGAWIATAGNHTVTAVVDDINRFAEGNENNNLFSVPLSVYVPSYTVNSGGNAVGAFSADANFSGTTNIFSIVNAIDLTGASNAAPQAIYQSERWGPSKYTFANLGPNQLYKVRLHFAEISPSVTQAGDRRFNVSINGVQVLTNFDIFATAGAKFRAVTKQFNAAADGLGNLLVHFSHGASNEPKISGLEIFPYTNTPPLLAAIGNKTINAGATLVFTNTATDTDIPADTLAFDLAVAPANAVISSATGVFTWTAPLVTTTQTNSVTVRVSDNGSPSLSDLKTFSLLVVAPPKILGLQISDGNASLTWQTFPGKTYKVQFKNSLNDGVWTDLTGTMVAAGSTLTANNSIGNAERYYRILQLD